MQYHSFFINQNYKSIYLFLKENGFSENYISNLRKTWGNLIVNDEKVNIRRPLYIGDKVKINNSPNKKTDIATCIIPLDIVYEDEYYILISKPSGLPCMPTRSHYTKNLAGAICNYMKDKNPDFVLRIINRLDKDTSGIIIIAKDSISQNKITRIEKDYHAICKGSINRDLTINSPIKTIINHGKNEHKRIISTDGKEATTIINPINTNPNYSLISARLIHGRTHQIRLHLSSIGHPLVGDSLYGKESDLINHTALICKKVSFFHPYKQQILNFEVEYPKDFQSVLEKLGL